uniref:HAT C-terminal dimerisation domain-containing protein n=2 Tax=Fusarium oxysporum (strain Fo5176) TaxID=660025 RepID=A0A0D2YDT7_FUSOF
MVHSIEMGWFILDKYYALIESTPVYAAAMLLDPSKRKYYLLQNWPEEWRQRLSILLIRSGRRNTRFSLMNHSLPLLLLLISILQPTLQEDEDMFMAFIEDKTIDIDALKITPLQWWLTPEQRRRYPRLHRMAINILSIAPSSAELEQQSSGARHKYHLPPCYQRWHSQLAPQSPIRGRCRQENRQDSRHYEHQIDGAKPEDGTADAPVDR